MRGNNVYLRSKIAIPEALIQAETQTVLWLGGEGKGYLWEKKGE